MIYSNKVLYCLSFISLVTVCLGNTSSVHLIKGRQYADRPLAVMINRLYSLLGGTRCTVDKINDGNPINQSSCVQCNFGTVQSNNKEG